jgi:dolichol-phosphate mannosyltransferase
MYFEEAVAEECYKRLLEIAVTNKINYEMIFVNDGSADGTLEILERIAKNDKQVKLISFSRNFGHQIAVTAGLDKAKGDAVVVIDADLQDPPELIPKMIDLWEQGYDVVYGKRKKRDGETWFKLITAKYFYRFLNKMSSVKIPMDTGDFRLMDKKVVAALKQMPEKNRFLRGMASWVGFKQTPLEYERHERFAGETKYPLKKMIKFAMDGIIAFSSKPLKMVEYIGLLTVIIAFLILVYALISRVFGLGNLVSGWTSIITSIAFLGGIQLLSVGIIGEYIARIYDESKGRPLYIIEKEINLEQVSETPLYLITNEGNMGDKAKGVQLIENNTIDNAQSYGVK